MKVLIYFTALLFSSLAVGNEAVVEKFTGSVTATSQGGSPAAIAVGQRLRSNTTVTTGDGAQLILRFTDGQIVSLHSNTQLKIATYNFEAASPASGNSVLELFKGAARFVSGLLAKSNPNAFKLSTPTATIGIRGTDFMASYHNPTFVSVLQGNVILGNNAGTLGLSAGQIGNVATAGLAPVSVSAATLPAAVSSAFSALAGQTLAAVAGVAGSTASGGTAAGTAGATGAAVGSVSAGTVAAVVAFTAAAAAAASGGDGGQTTSTTTATH